MPSNQTMSTPSPSQPRVSQPAGGNDSTLATTAVSGLVIGLAVVSVALRFYTRIFTRQGLRWDDWMIFIAVLTTLLTAALLLYGNDVSPNGLWVSENTDPNYVYSEADHLYLKLSFISSVLYFTIASTTKLGILLMYNRIFFVSDAFRVQLWITSALIVVFWIGCTVATLTNCIPLEWSWINSLADPRYCFNYNIFWMAAGACEMFLDVLVLTMPISVVIRMRLSLRDKLTAAGIFLLGGFVIITGLVKVILGYPPGSRVPSYHNTEVWTTVHTGMAIVCASLPIFKPLLWRIRSSSFAAKIFSGSKSSSHGSSSWSTSRKTNTQTDNGIITSTQPEPEVTKVEVSIGCMQLPPPETPRDDQFSTIMQLALLERGYTLDEGEGPRPDSHGESHVMV
ncbi:hypothetical protein B0H63DRAFT_194916 [Podospora didyma]|uniref:Rhodopsin domain-containing protein n=1 Tax=Podospora didyma TaxID=330526 RepID=A0AAE0TVA0_9PEZI|nr:hypothetical protein B0H63DRAFT_194916 [Podospora didyma]